MSTEEPNSQEQSETRSPYASPITRTDGTGFSLFTTSSGIEIDIDLAAGQVTVSYTNEELVRLGGYWGDGLAMVASSYYSHQGEFLAEDRLLADRLQ